MIVSIYCESIFSLGYCYGVPHLILRLGGVAGLYPDKGSSRGA